MNYDAQSQPLPNGGKNPNGGAGDWKTHPFLQAMSAAHLDALSTCAMPTKFEAGQLIFREGEIANRFYLISEGRVLLEAEAADRPGIPVAELHAGDVLGWSWLFPPYTWNFTARAIEPVKAIFFYGTWLRDRCEAEPALGYELMKRTAALVIRRLQATRQQLVRAST